MNLGLVGSLEFQGKPEGLIFNMYLDYLSLAYGKGAGRVDCFQLVRLFYEREFGISIPNLDYPEDWYNDTPNLIIENYKSYGFTECANDSSYGDVVVFYVNNVPRHLGIMIKSNYFLHSTKNGVAVHSITSGKWLSRVAIKLRHKGVLNDIFFS